MSESQIESQVNQITPGKCPPGGCPPFDRIECIAVDKVYDSCFQIHDLTRDTSVTFTGSFTEGSELPCAQNGPISCQEVSRTNIGGGFFSVNTLITVPMVISNPNDPEETADKTFSFSKTVTLCCPEGVAPDCAESKINLCNCMITEIIPPNGAVTLVLTCTLQICLVIKCIVNVQLLVPSYGFCVPAPCLALPGVCPPTPPAQCF